MNNSQSSSHYTCLSLVEDKFLFFPRFKKLGRNKISVDDLEVLNP